DLNDQYRRESSYVLGHSSHHVTLGNRFSVPRILADGDERGACILHALQRGFPSSAWASVSRAGRISQHYDQRSDGQFGPRFQRSASDDSEHLSASRESQHL